MHDVKIQLRSEAVEGHYYQYTHGLAKHRGHCQRIAHGHRSRIEVWLNNHKATQVEAMWAERLKDTYIATTEHIQANSIINGVQYSHIAYTAPEGEFEITLPQHVVFSIPTDTTVENIAAHLAQLIADEQQTTTLVKAYEGVNKGAFSLFSN